MADVEVLGTAIWHLVVHKYLYHFLPDNNCSTSCVSIIPTEEDWT